MFDLIDIIAHPTVYKVGNLAQLLLYHYLAIACK